MSVNTDCGKNNFLVNKLSMPLQNNATLSSYAMPWDTLQWCTFLAPNQIIWMHFFYFTIVVKKLTNRDSNNSTTPVERNRNHPSNLSVPVNLSVVRWFGALERDWRPMLKPVYGWQHICFCHVYFVLLSLPPILHTIGCQGLGQWMTSLLSYKLYKWTCYLERLSQAGNARFGDKLSWNSEDDQGWRCR